MGFLGFSVIAGFIILSNLVIYLHFGHWAGLVGVGFVLGVWAAYIILLLEVRKYET